MTMTEIDRSAILKQMGITRWMLRDAVADTVVDEAIVDAEDATAPETATLKPVEIPVEPMASERIMPEVANQGASSTAPDAESKLKPKSVSSTPKPVPTVPLRSTVQTLAALRAEVEQCTACKLAESRTRTVFGSGPEQSDWLFVGEAPGQQEDRQGKPFVGRAGSLLTQMLLALGQQREQVFITNTLKCRPPDNRDPFPEELQACEPFLLKQLELVKPKVMVALGVFSAQALLNSDQPLGKLRGQVYRYGPDNIPLIVTYHPAYLLRNPADKEKVWEDLLLANRQLPE